MSVEQMDETFAAGLRTLLVTEVSRGGQRRFWRRRRRLLPLAGALLAVAAGGGGIAYATGAFRNQPGTEEFTDLTTPVTVTEVGTHTIQLGSAPSGATDLALRFRCLSAGQYLLGSSGAGGLCDAAERPLPASVPPGALPITPGMHSFKVTASPRMRWTLTIGYARALATPWAVNASGQTYGVANRAGTPVLVSAMATDHRVGYVYARQLQGPEFKTPAQALAHNGERRVLKVYLSDGKTQIGHFVVGP